MDNIIFIFLILVAVQQFVCLYT